MALVVVAADQLTKLLVVAALGRDATDLRRELLGAVLALEYVENTGAAFGVLRGQGLLLTVAAGVLVAALVVYYRRAGQAERFSPVLASSLGLLAGGAAGNVVDRLRLGYVIDFIAVGIWPKFNVADSAISIGVVLLAWHLFRDSGEPSRPEAAILPEGERRANGDGSISRLRKAARQDGGRP